MHRPAKGHGQARREPHEHGPRHCHRDAPARQPPPQPPGEARGRRPARRGPEQRRAQRGQREAQQPEFVGQGPRVGHQAEGVAGHEPREQYAAERRGQQAPGTQAVEAEGRRDEPGGDAEHDRARLVARVRVGPVPIAVNAAEERQVLRDGQGDDDVQGDEAAVGGGPEGVARPLAQADVGRGQQAEARGDGPEGGAAFELFVDAIEQVGEQDRAGEHLARDAGAQKARGGEPERGHLQIAESGATGPVRPDAQRGDDRSEGREGEAPAAKRELMWRNVGWAHATVQTPRDPGFFPERAGSAPAEKGRGVWAGRGGPRAARR